MARKRIVWEKKTNQKEVTQKLRKRKKSFFFYATYRLSLIHITIKFTQDILYGSLVMVRTSYGAHMDSRAMS